MFSYDFSFRGRLRTFWTITQSVYLSIYLSIFKNSFLTHLHLTHHVYSLLLRPVFLHMGDIYDAVVFFLSMFILTILMLLFCAIIRNLISSFVCRLRNLTQISSFIMCIIYPWNSLYCYYLPLKSFSHQS